MLVEDLRVENTDICVKYVFVADVVKGDSADKFGLSVGDVIVQLSRGHI